MRRLTMILVVFTLLVLSAMAEGAAARPTSGDRTKTGTLTDASASVTRTGGSVTVSESSSESSSERSSPRRRVGGSVGVVRAVGCTWWVATPLGSAFFVLGDATAMAIEIFKSGVGGHSGRH